MSPTSTKCTVTTDLHITGKVAQFGRGIMGDVSKKLMEQFAANLNTMLDNTALDNTAHDKTVPDKAGSDVPSEPDDAGDTTSAATTRNGFRVGGQRIRSRDRGADEAHHQRTGDGADRRGGHGRPGVVEAHRSGGARAARRVPAAAPTPLTRWTTGRGYASSSVVSRVATSRSS